jgi:hypothetical protein
MTPLCRTGMSLPNTSKRIRRKPAASLDIPLRLQQIANSGNNRLHCFARQQQWRGVPNNISLVKQLNSQVTNGYKTLNLPVVPTGRSRPNLEQLYAIVGTQ